MRRLLWLVALVTSPAFAAIDNYYVRTDGDDTVCNGTADVSCVSVGCSGGPKACAKRTIGAAETVATDPDNSGIHIHVGAGNFYEPTAITLSETGVSNALRHKISGAGAGNTFVFMGLSAPLTCGPDGTHTYSCTVPAGGVTNSPAQIGRVGVCLTMAGTTPGVNDASDIDIQPTGSTAYTINEFACLTPASSDTTTTIDHDDNGVDDTALDSTNARGMWYAASGGAEYIINPWSTTTQPGDSGITYYAPTSTTANIAIQNEFQTIEDMTIYSGPGITNAISVSNSGENYIIEDVRLFGAGIVAGSAFDGTCTVNNTVIRRVLVHHGTRRKIDEACGEFGNPCASISGPHESANAAQISGCDVLIEDLITVGGREGVSFAGQRHTVRRMQVSSFFNHGLRADNVLMTATWENVLSYGHGVDATDLAECVQGLTIKHSTITGARLWMYGLQDPAGSSYEACLSGIQGMSGILLVNNIIEGIIHDDQYCDTGAAFIQARQANGGAPNNDYDYNIYFSTVALVEDERCPSTEGGEDFAYTTLAGWQAHSGGADLCTTTCIRDENSCPPQGGGPSTTCPSGPSTLFVSPSDDDIDDASPPDYHLLSSASAVNSGSASYAPTGNNDFEGVSRDGTPDIGAYEFSSAPPSVTGASMSGGGIQ